MQHKPKFIQPCIFFRLVFFADVIYIDFVSHMCTCGFVRIYRSSTGPPKNSIINPSNVGSREKLWPSLWLMSFFYNIGKLLSSTFDLEKLEERKKLFISVYTIPPAWFYD